MKSIASLVPALMTLLLLAACGNVSPVGTASQATATGSTASLTLPIEQPRAVRFVAGDGTQLSGLLYGQGRTAVILSHMSDSDKSEWAEMAERLAGLGYAALTFDFRGRGDSEGSFTPPLADHDLLAAITFAKQEGAVNIVLVGASMGAMASLKAAAVERPLALVALAGATSWSGLTVTDAELEAISAPKLYISSEQDPYISGTLHLFDAAPDPKEKHIYPGSAHGTQLFADYGPDLTERIVTFITENAPPD